MNTLPPQKLDANPSAQLSTPPLTGQPVDIAKEIIRRTLTAFPVERIGVSFNGGKDSVVVVELILATLGLEWLRRCCVFVLVDGDAEFSEMETFRRRYVEERLPGVKLHEVVSCEGLKAGLWKIKEQFNIDAVFMGTRKDDPSGKYHSSPWEPTTAGWPAMVRVCPVLQWTYTDVWEYILSQRIAYCELYGRGYTSLGDRRVTSPNDNLMRQNGEYAPAWMLKQADLERVGRVEEEKLSC